MNNLQVDRQDAEIVFTTSVYMCAWRQEDH